MTAARDEADEVSLLPLPADVFVKILLFVRNSRDLNSVARSCRVLNQLMTWRKLKRHVAGLLLEDESLVPMQLTRAHLDNLMRTVPQQTLSEFRPRGPIAKSNLSFELPLFVRPVYFALMGCKVGVDPAQYSGSFESPKGGFFHVVAVPYRPGQAVVHLRGAILRSNLHADALEDLDRMRNEAISTIGKNCLLFVHATVKRSVVLNEVTKLGKCVLLVSFSLSKPGPGLVQKA